MDKTSTTLRCAEGRYTRTCTWKQLTPSGWKRRRSWCSIGRKSVDAASGDAARLHLLIVDTELLAAVVSLCGYLTGSSVLGSILLVLDVCGNSSSPPSLDAHDAWQIWTEMVGLMGVTVDCLCVHLYRSCVQVVHSYGCWYQNEIG